MRYQQVYAASAFAAVSPTGGYITRIFLRADENSQGAVGSSTNIQINFSSTSKQPDGLSQVFAENVGSDETIVFGPASFHISSPEDVISFTTPFWYNPTNGNLLLDVRIYNGGFPLPSQFHLDAHFVTNDSVSRVYAESINATSATQVDTVGITTLFEFNPVPALQIQQTSDSIVVSWPVDPEVFVLQSADTLSAQANWQRDTNRVEQIGFNRTVTLPRDSLVAARFFRLIWESGQPIQPATAPAAPGRTRELPRTK